MNIIKEQREQIIKENNTAQSSFAFFLENSNKLTDTLVFQHRLHGDLDLKIITEMGFRMVSTIRLTEGEITSIINFPENLLHFECNKNLLTNIEDLPPSLISLTLDNNYIENINISYLLKLKTLNISHNKLTELIDLPKSLTSLQCDYNLLSRINLDKLELTTLNIDYNQISIIENLPNNIVNFTYENNPSIEFRNNTDIIEIPRNATLANDDKQIKYIEALNEYFKLKNIYMTELMELKRKIFKRADSKRKAHSAILLIKMPCIKCKRKVNTTFYTKDNRHIAICGDKISPCTLNIQLFNGESNTSILETISDFREHINEVKMSIIQHKFDSLFNYMTDEQSLELYKTELEEFNLDSSIYKEYIDIYNNLYNNSNTNALIEKKNADIFKLIENNKQILNQYDTLNESKNIELIHNVVYTQVHQILPETRNVSLLKYNINEIIREEIKQGVYQYRLNQSQVDPNKNYIYINEPPRVIHFVK